MPEQKPVGESQQALFQHCVTTYKAMLAEADGRIAFDEESGESQTIIVWEGMLTQFITGDLHLSVPYYTHITRALKRMGCVAQLRRGGGSSPSQWQLIKEPDYDSFLNAYGPRKKRQNANAGLQDQLNSMNRRLGRVEEALQAFIKEQEDESVQDG